MATVRHWRYGNQHDHSANTVGAALDKCLKCAGLDVSEMSKLSMSIQLVQQGRTSYVIPNVDVHNFHRIGKP